MLSMTGVEAAKVILPGSLAFCGILVGLILFLINRRKKADWSGVSNRILKKYQNVTNIVFIVLILAVLSALSALFFLLGQKILYEPMLILFVLTIAGTITGVLLTVIVTKG